MCYRLHESSGLDGDVSAVLQQQHQALLQPVGVTADPYSQLCQQQPCSAASAAACCNAQQFDLCIQCEVADSWLAQCLYAKALQHSVKRMPVLMNSDDFINKILTQQKKVARSSPANRCQALSIHESPGLNLSLRI